MGRARTAYVLMAASLALAAAREVAAASYAYILGTEGTVVSRMDLASNEAVPITVGGYPAGLGASADGSVVVVSNLFDGTVSVIDGIAATVTGTIPVGTNPEGVAVTPDGTKAFVVNLGDQTISVVDLVAGAVSNTIPAEGQLGGIAMSPGGQRAYVANASFAGTLLVIDTVAEVVLTETVVSPSSFAYTAVVSPDGSRVWVGLDSKIAIIDTATNLFVDDVTLTGECCDRVTDVAIAPDASRVYVSLLVPGGAIEIDATTLATTPLPTSSAFSATNGVGVSSDGDTLYVVNQGAETIDLIDTATRTVRATIGALVEGPAVRGEMIVGPTEPVEPPAPPLLGSAPRACQKSLLDSFKTYGAKAHQLLSGCLLRVQKDHAAGAITSGTTAACAKDVDTANPASRIARARALARTRILSGCAASTPAALGAPCDAAATTTSALADCVLDRQLAGVASVLAGEVTAPCQLLGLVGLDLGPPELCE